jgi:CheY-specific phosphatase CheX
MEKEKFQKFLDFTQKAFLDISLELVSESYNYLDDAELDAFHTLAVVIGITGNSKGRIIIESSFETAKKFAVLMNCGDPLDEENDVYLYMAEFANMVSGRTATHANNEFKERFAWLAPPAIFAGENLEIASPNIICKDQYYTGEAGMFKVSIGFGG